MRITKKKLKEIGFVDDVVGINLEYYIKKGYNKIVYYGKGEFTLYQDKKYYTTLQKIWLKLNMEDLINLIKILKRN